MVDVCVREHNGIDRFRIEGKVSVPLIRLGSSSLEESAIQHHSRAVNVEEVHRASDSSCSALEFNSHVLLFLEFLQFSLRPEIQPVREIIVVVIEDVLELSFRRRGITELLVAKRALIMGPRQEPFFSFDASFDKFPEELKRFCR